MVAAEVPDPVPGRGQVVVDVSVAEVLFVEAQIRRGELGDFFQVTPPYVPGGAVAGTISAVGDGVDTSWVGREVATRTVDAGGYAERALAAADAVHPVPDGLSAQTAAALLHDGLTGMGLFEAAAIRPGQRVLITGAAGGMGVLLVQLSRAAGAHVIAAARGARKLALLERLGAEVVVDYSEADWHKRVRAATDGADVVFDGVGGQIGREAFEITRIGGWFSAHGAPSGDFAAVDQKEAEDAGITLRGIKDVWFGPEESRKLTERVLVQAAAGTIRPAIGQTFPLERAADAHVAIEARTAVGKTLLLV